jgi:FKBP-type peptidyl-prolyl cis-trans isomerase
MKKILWWFFPLFVVNAVVTSCGDDDDLKVDQIAQTRKYKEENETYLKEKRAQSDVKEDPSGLLYTVISQGVGERPLEDDTVIVTYTGKTIRDSVFVSKTETVALSDLGEGLRIGLRHMPAGSNYHFFIPYYLMYGATSTQFVYGGKRVSVLSYSTLVYNMTLNAVIKKQE